MKYSLALAILLVIGVANAYTVTMNFAARITDGTNSTLRVNDTSYNSSLAAAFPSLSKNYAAINKTNVLSAIVSPDSSTAIVNGSYSRYATDSSSLISLRLDNSTLDTGGIKNGTIQGSVACNIAGKINGACAFSGGYVNFSTLDLQGNRNYTISTWIRSSASGGIFSQSDGTANHLIALQLIGGVTRFATFEGGAGNIDDDTAINDNLWHHIAAVKNGTSGILYVDGVAQASGTVALVSSTTDARIGTMYNLTSPFIGDIDEFTVFNRTLSAIEVRELYEHDPRYSLIQLTSNDRFLITATNGTHDDIDSKLGMLSNNGIISSTFGRFATAVLSSYNIFIRLEYTNIDIENKIEWSGNGRLVIRNVGLNSIGFPIVRLELIR